MSLATRCPACGTVFRVVQDQLRVSEGWVRCGRCSDVFNAVESLVDLASPDPAPAAEHSAHLDRVIDDLAQVAGQTPAPAAVVAAATPRPA
ncbi:MAG: zinc-ribbon domain-containing protein, partial [Rubrivivax sp.]|nr:zinc-ribbon domain-containing protein [Rubrivivax sp.]